jgi:cyclopropane fatty-acyl-phospholipid synthase-like methyltransferase
MNKPYSPACDRNREPILAVIRSLLSESRCVLEIGSGTGQHAVYFAAGMPHLQWITSDRQEHHAGIRLWLDEAGLPNLHYPLQLDVTQPEWPAVNVDAVFSANTVHIMSWDAVRLLIPGVAGLLRDNGLFILYGPFNYGNRYSSDSNAEFDIWLKSQDPQSSIRNFEDIDQLAVQSGLQLLQDYAMPANNRILCWQKIAGEDSPDAAKTGA